VLVLDAPVGLLGNANGNASDDLQTPNHVLLPSNATARQLYEEFGLTCKFFFKTKSQTSCRSTNIFISRIVNSKITFLIRRRHHNFSENLFELFSKYVDPYSKQSTRHLSVGAVFQKGIIVIRVLHLILLCTLPYRSGYKTACIHEKHLF